MKKLNNFLRRGISVFLVVIFVIFMFGVTLRAQTMTFTYQGRLTDSAMAASGTYDFEFALYDANAAGTQQGATQTVTGVNVAAGTFAVPLDFTAAPFAAGADRYLEIRVKKPADPTFTTLIPRERMTSAPYSIQSLNATNAARLGGLAATSYLQTNGDGSQLTNVTVNAANLTGVVPISKGGTGSATQNFVDLTTTQTIAGSKTFSSAVNTGVQYNINGSRILSVAGNGNLFVGINAGMGNTTGFSSTFVGADAGRSNTTGGQNSFFGIDAGIYNTTGFSNTFVGAFAGIYNTTGGDNSFVGTLSGLNNGSGGSNSFFGTTAGISNTTGNDNSFLGKNAGYSTTAGNDNSFVGRDAGYGNTTGSFNSFLGKTAGNNNTTGSNNTIIGYAANVSVNNLTFATALGGGATVSTSNTVVLGRTADTVIAPNLLQVDALGTAGTAQLCRNALNQISTCSSSLRYKTNIAPFSFGMTQINQLRPISFDWKAGGLKDIGFGAEDVAAVNPLLVNYNDKGEIEGVKYDRLSVLFVNAFREQQTQIEKQQREIDELKQIICAIKPEAAFCQRQK